MSNVVQFRTGWRAVLTGGVVTGGDDPAEVGSVRYFIELLDGREAGCVIWDGASLTDGRLALESLQQDGIRTQVALGV